MKKIFISYSHNDFNTFDFVDQLKLELSKMDVEVFVPNDISFGDDIQATITEQLNSANLVVCFYDSKSVWSSFELGFALGRNKDVLVIASKDNLPMELKRLSFINRDKPQFEIFKDIISYIEKTTIINDEYRELFDTSNIDDKIRLLSEKQNLLDSLSGQEFENVLREWFIYHGYQIEQASEYRDYGYDFKIYREDGEPIIVEIKKYNKNSRVSIGVINQLLGTMSVNNINRGVVISSSGFTKSAQGYSLDLEQEVKLVSLSDLINMDFNI